MAGDNWGFTFGTTPFRPAHDIEEMSRRFENEYIRPAMRAVWERIPDNMKAWAPAVNVIEKGDSFEVKVELPGVKQNEINVSVADDVLTISGERKPDAGVKDEEYRRAEIAYGAFYRSVVLPGKVDTKTVDAVYEDGMLRVTLQREGGVKAKKVNIQVKKNTA
jgi:HSP20 family protein